MATDDPRVFDIEPIPNIAEKLTKWQFLQILLNKSLSRMSANVVKCPKKSGIKHLKKPERM